MLLLIFALALSIRLVFIGVWYQRGQGARLSADSQSYFDIAQSMAAGKGFQLEGTPTARRPPLYPLLIAFFLKMNIPFPLGVQLAQAGLGAFSCVFLYGLGNRIFDEKTSWLASLVLALDYSSARVTMAVMSENLFVFFLLITFFFLFEAYRKKQKKWIVFSAIASGLTLLTRDVLILYFPLIMVWMVLWKGTWKTKLRAACLYGFCLTLTLAPWILRNSLKFHQLVFVTNVSGHTFYLANNPRATGGTTGGDWVADQDTAYPQASEKLPPLYTVEADRYLLKEGLKFILDQPVKFFSLIQKKVANTWRPCPTDSPLATQLIMIPSYLLVMILSLVGFYQAKTRWLELLPIFLLIAYVFALHAVLISGIRYRFPVMPFFMLFAAHGFWILTEKRPFLAPLRQKS